MNRKEARKLNERIASYERQIHNMSLEEQIKLFEVMLENEGLSPLDTFEAVPQHDLLLDTTTDMNNRWMKVNSSICTVEETAIARQFQEFPFDVIREAGKALRCIKENFPNEGKDIKATGITEVATA